MFELLSELSDGDPHEYKLGRLFVRDSGEEEEEVTKASPLPV